MREAGRNDPCPCGSGIKYKYCCLHKDQDEGDESSPSPTATTTDEPTLSSAEEAWETFEAADYEGRRALVEELVGDPDRMDAENAFHMINDLAPKAIEREETDWVAHIITRLEDEQPETYAEELPYLLSRHLEAAAVTGRIETVAAERVEDLATVASQDIDQFYPCIELIAYHGSVAPIAEAMQHGWAAVRKSSDVMPFAKNEFGNEAVQYAILAHYEQHGEVDVHDLDLQAQIDRIDDPATGEVDTDYVECIAARLSDLDEQTWSGNDDVVEDIHWLSVDFMRTVHEETDLPLGRAHLARESIENCYARRHEESPSLKTERLLRLEQRDVRQQLDELGHFLSSHPHRMGAFFSLLPRWLDFLERQGILNAAKTNTTYQNLRPLRTEVTNALRYFSSDPALVRDVKAAWE